MAQRKMNFREAAEILDTWAAEKSTLTIIAYVRFFQAYISFSGTVEKGGKTYEYRFHASGESGLNVDFDVSYLAPLMITEEEAYTLIVSAEESSQVEFGISRRTKDVAGSQFPWGASWIQ